MNFKISRNLLEQTLQNVSKGLSTKTPMPILMGIQITATTNSLTFVTTNKEISIKITLNTSDELMIFEEGSCVIPGKFFVDIVKKLEGNDVEFMLFEENYAKIISNKSEFTLVTYDKSNFPVTNFDLNVSPILISCKELKQIIKQTSFACSSSDSRIILTSINFMLKEQELTVISTDSFRLAKRTADVESSQARLQLNLPSKSLEEFAKIITDQNETVELLVTNNKALFKYKNLNFMTRLVEGSFPDTSSLFPKNHLFNIKFNRAALIAAVDRASLFFEPNDLNFVKLNITSYSNEIEISSNSSEIGRVEEKIVPVEISENVDFQIAFSAKYLLDALKAFETKEVTMYFTGEVKPAVITSDEFNNLTQLLIPVRVF